MSLCLQTADGLHRWEFLRHFDRADHYVCLNALCGETLTQYDDGER